MGLARGIRVWLALGHVRYDRGVVVQGELSNLHLAEGVQLGAHVVLHAGGLAWCDYRGHLEIGSGSVISPSCVLYGAGPGGIRIGRDFDCGPLVGIFASRTDFASDSRGHIFAPVVIGDRVTVFAGAVISPGVTIGDGATIAANSVVTSDVPPGAFVGGAPTRIIRSPA